MKIRPPTRTEHPVGLPRVPGYEIERPLRLRGELSVLLARRRGLPLVLKVLDLTACDLQTKLRFLREVELTARLEHPNVVRVVDSGAHQGLLYLACERLVGLDLSERLEAGPLPAADVVRVGLGAARGLSAGHALGIVHRDVTPSNLFCCEDGVVKVLDFGLAVSVAAPRAPRLTATRTIVGTPAYMAPEQVLGSRDEDPRTDVWGLGATLYHAAAGRVPFPGADLSAVLHRVVSRAPEPLPAAVPESLARVLARALRSRPSDRWPSMPAFADALEHALRGSRAGSSKAVLVDLDPELRTVAVLAIDRRSRHFAAAVRRRRGEVVGPAARGPFAVFASGDVARRAVDTAQAVRAEEPSVGIAVTTTRTPMSPRGSLSDGVLDRARAMLVPGQLRVDAETERRVVRRSEGATRRARAAATPRTPLVGREGEIELLRADARRALADEHGTAAGVVVEGAVGVGKSRLVAEIRAWLTTEHPDALVLECRGDVPRRAGSWRGTAELLRPWLGLPADATAPQWTAALRRAVPELAFANEVGGALARRFADQGRLAARGQAAGAAGDRVRVGLGDVFDSMTSARRVVLVIEDAHGLDAATAWLVDELLRRFCQRRLFVIAAARPASAVPWQALRPLSLPPLPRRDARLLAQRLLGPGRSGGAAAIVDDVCRRAAGNPLFIEELSRAHLDGRAGLPATIEAAIQDRLDALGRRERHLLRAAAVFGMRFSPEGLRAVAGPFSSSALARIERAGLIVPTPRLQVGDGPQWAFASVLVQEVSAGTLTSEQTRSLHGRAAEHLARSAEASPLQIAEHFDRAGRPDRAAACWIEASFRALAAGDHDTFLTASARALAGPVPRAAAFRLQAALDDLWFHRACFADQEPAIEALRRLARTPIDRGLVVERRVRHLRCTGRADEALAVLRAGLRRWPSRVGLVVEDAAVKWMLGELREAVERARQALDLARAGRDALAIGRAAAALGSCEEQLGNIVASEEARRIAFAAFRTAGDPRRAISIQVDLAYCRLALGRAADARALLIDVVEECRAIGSRLSENTALHNLGLALARTGEAERGLAVEREALALARTLGHSWLQLASCLYCAAILLGLDRPAEALPYLDLIEHGAGALGTEALGLRASALVALGRTREARGAAEAALSARARAGGMAEFEAELFLAAAAAGVPGALAAGRAAIEQRAEAIPDPELRRSFLGLPANAALLARPIRSQTLKRKCTTSPSWTT